MKKFLAILMMLTLMLTLFAGCAKNAAPKADSSTTKAPVENKLSKDEEAIIADLKKELNVDGYEEQIAAELKADKDFVATMNAAGIDVDEYVNAIAPKYKWEIGKITVDGKEAVAKVTMTYPDYEKMDSLLDQKIDEYLATNDASKLSDADAQKLVGDMMMEIVKSDELPVAAADFDIDYVKENGIWKMVDSEEIEQAMIDVQDVNEAA